MTCYASGGYYGPKGEADVGSLVDEMCGYVKIGFTAVKADVPEGMPATQYAEWIAGYGLAPSLSLFSSPFDETIDIVEEIERAKRFAADQVELPGKALG